MLCVWALWNEQSHKKISHIAGNHRSAVDSEGEFITLAQIEEEDYIERDSSSESEESDSESEDSDDDSDAESEDSDAESEDSDAESEDSDSES